MNRQTFLALFLLSAACSRTTPPATTPVPAAQGPAGSPSPTPRSQQPPAPREGLPPIPTVNGPLAIRVIYPAEGAPMAARDSNYMIGSVGTGSATLTINGYPATVYPNGAFMAFIRNPPPTMPQFTLVAAAGPDTARYTHNLRTPPVFAALPLEGRLIVDSTEFAPRASNVLFLRDDERTTVRIRIPINATATLVTPTQRLPLDRSGEIASRAFTAAELRAGGMLVIGRGSDTTRLPVSALRGPRIDAPEFIRLGRGVTAADTDAVIYGRVLPNDNYKWFLLPGTVAEMTGRNGAYTRIRVANDLEMWVADVDVDTVTPSPPARRTTSNGRVRSSPLSADLVIPMTSTPAFFVEEHDRQIELVVYGVQGNTDVINYPTGDTLIKSVTWEQESADRIRFTLHLAQPPVGWMAVMERGNFVLRVRRAPAVEAANPLRGRVIALDPGHPPAGATGPTALYEGQASLWVAERAKAMLEAKGATVVMTRTTMDPLELPPRRAIARRADADAFVSIHLNAFPDGVNPFIATVGTGTYFYRTHAEPLARAAQAAMLANMSLRDEGVFYRSLAVTVQSWMPAVLLEGAYLIIPEQEAAMRTENYQDRYAKSIVEGLEAYFRSLAR
ncbi:MAG: N-acetylmuramoyl-L-alanine amidase [Gemmatimonadaceae bacterium]